MASGPVMSSPSVLERHDLELDLSRGALDRDDVTDLAFHQRLAERRLEAELALGRVRLVRADQRMGLLVAILVAHADAGAEADDVPADLLGSHHDGGVEPLGQEAHAPINLAQPLLAVDILGV